VELYFQYAFMEWCLVKAQGQLYLYLLLLYIALHFVTLRYLF